VSRMSVKKVGQLSDSLYVPRVQVCERSEPDVKIKDRVYAGSYQKDAPKMSVVCVEVSTVQCVCLLDHSGGGRVASSDCCRTPW